MTPGETPAPDPAVQAAYGDAINRIRDEGVVGEVATIRQQIPRLRRQLADGHLDERGFADKLEFLNRQITAMRGIDKATRQALLGLVKAAGD